MVSNIKGGLWNTEKQHCKIINFKLCYSKFTEQEAAELYIKGSIGDYMDLEFLYSESA